MSSTHENTSAGVGDGDQRKLPPPHNFGLGEVAASQSHEPHDTFYASDEGATHLSVQVLTQADAHKIDMYDPTIDLVQRVSSSEDEETNIIMKMNENEEHTDTADDEEIDEKGKSVDDDTSGVGDAGKQSILQGLAATMVAYGGVVLQKLFKEGGEDEEDALDEDDVAAIGQLKSENGGGGGGSETAFGEAPPPPVENLVAGYNEVVASMSQNAAVSAGNTIADSILFPGEFTESSRTAAAAGAGAGGATTVVGAVVGAAAAGSMGNAAAAGAVSGSISAATTSAGAAGSTSAASATATVTFNAAVPSTTATPSSSAEVAGATSTASSAAGSAAVASSMAAGAGSGPSAALGGTGPAANAGMAATMQMEGLSQMAVTAAQSAAVQVASGATEFAVCFSSGLPTAETVFASTKAVIAGLVIAGVLVLAGGAMAAFFLFDSSSGRIEPVCKDVTDFKTSTGLVLFEASPLVDSFTENYNFILGCTSDFNQVVRSCRLDCRTIETDDGPEEQCCTQANTAYGEALRCAFSCDVHCVGCPVFEPLFWMDNATDANDKEFVSVNGTSANENEFALSAFGPAVDATSVANGLDSHPEVPERTLLEQNNVAGNVCDIGLQVLRKYCGMRQYIEVCQSVVVRTMNVVSGDELQNCFISSFVREQTLSPSALTKHPTSGPLSMAEPTSSPIPSHLYMTEEPTVRAVSESQESLMPLVALPTNSLLSDPSSLPSANPTLNSDKRSLSFPTNEPTMLQTALSYPSPKANLPLTNPTTFPATAGLPSLSPSTTSMPSIIPTDVTGLPFATPIDLLSTKPTSLPSTTPSSVPTKHPSTFPAKDPTIAPEITLPSSNPTRKTLVHPTGLPTGIPTSLPLAKPTVVPTKSPLTNPTVLLPTAIPAKMPAVTATNTPSTNPKEGRTNFPLTTPTMFPSNSPSSLPVIKPKLGSLLCPL